MSAPALIPLEQLEHATEEELATYLAHLQQLTEPRDPAGWNLTRAQLRFDLAADRAFETLVGGAAGGGKSEWLLWRAYQMSVRYPGHQTIMFRRTYPELLASLIERSLQRFDQKLARYKSGEHVWVFRNGSKIRFSHMERAIDRYSFQSTEWDLICWDELTHFDKSMYTSPSGP